jgi:hypothetical protein
MGVGSVFSLRTGLPYWANHVWISVLIGLLLGNFLCGATFYVGREIRDWEKIGNFDHLGFWPPVGVCVALETIWRVYGIPRFPG